MCTSLGSVEGQDSRSFCPAGIHKTSSCQEAWAPTAAAGVTGAANTAVVLAGGASCTLALFPNRKLVLCIITSIMLCGSVEWQTVPRQLLRRCLHYPSAAPGFLQGFYPLPEYRRTSLTWPGITLVLCGCFSIRPLILLDSRNSPFIWSLFPQRLKTLSHQLENEGPQSSFFSCGPYLKTFLNLLQYCFSFMFSFLAGRHVGS